MRYRSKEHGDSVSRLKMNDTTVNTTVLSCGAAFLLINPAEIFPDLRAVFIVRIVFNAITCPLIILLNILVMVAVKTKRQLRTKSNVALACLATTDFVVGLGVQPLQITLFSFVFFQGETEVFCSLHMVTAGTTVICTLASVYHLLLMSTERYVAIKHPFVHENQVTEVRIIIASGLAWAAAIVLSTQIIWLKSRHFMTILVPFVIMFVFFPAMIYFNGALYREVRRSEKEIAANQVSLEAKEKIFKNKKAFYTTTIVLLFTFLCYIPAAICLVILISLKDRIPINELQIVLYLVFCLPVLNSLLNPLIYAVRIRSFRVAFIQLLSRKTIAQAEEHERKIFGPRQIGVIANVEQGQNRAIQEDIQHENEILNNEHEHTVRTEPQEENEKISLRGQL